MKSALLIAKLESMQSEAINHLSRDEKPAARRLLQELIKQYLDLDPELDHVFITLYFNLLLSCLDQHDIPLEMIDATRGLVHHYRHLREPTPETLEVSKQLTLWLQQPHIEQLFQEFDGVDYVELCELVYRDFSPTLDLRDERFILEPYLKPNVIARLLRPMESGLFSYTLAQQWLNPVTVPTWLKPLYRQQLHTQPYPDVVDQHLSAFSDLFISGDYTQAYLELLHAFEWGVSHAPNLAFEWLIGLILLECKDELNHFNCIASLPIEHRGMLTIQLHYDFARMISMDRSADHLVSHHWQEVITLSQHQLKVIEHRHQEMNFRANGDHEKRGWLSLRIAEGFIAQGDEARAQVELEEALRQAHLDTYIDPILNVTLLSLSGLLLERQGLRDHALDEYYKVLERTIHQPILSYEDVARVDAWIFQGSDVKVRAQLVMIAIKRSADIIRLIRHENARWDLGLLHTLATGISGALSYAESQELYTYLGLTRASFGDQVGAECARKSALVLDHSSASLLSQLYMALIEEREVAHSTQSMMKIKNYYDRMLNEAKVSGSRSLLQQLQLRSIHLILKHKLHRYRQLTEPKRAQFERQLTQLLSRFYETLTSTPWEMFDLTLQLIPSYEVIELEGLAHTLSREMLVEPSRWLMRLLRADTHPHYLVSPKGRTSQLIKSVHYEIFQHNWIERQDVDLSLYQRYDQLMRYRELPRWRSSLTQAQASIIEYFVCEHWTLAFFSQDGLTIRGTRIDVPLQSIKAEMHTLLEYLIYNQEPSAYVVREQSQKLYEWLVSPFEQELQRSHRLLISVDQTLKPLPFSALQNSEGRYLGERFDLATSLQTSSPVFSTTPPLAEVSCLHYVSLTSDREMMCESLRERVSRELGEQGVRPISVDDWLMMMAPNRDPQVSGEEPLAQSMVILDAEISETGIGFRDPKRDQGDISAEDHLQHIIQTLVSLQVNTCVLTQSVSPFVVHDKTLRALLTSVYSGLIHCRWHSQAHLDLLGYLVEQLASSPTLSSVMSAMRRTREYAIQHRYALHHWAALELYISEGQLNADRS